MDNLLVKICSTNLHEEIVNHKKDYIIDPQVQVEFYEKTLGRLSSPPINTKGPNPTNRIINLSQLHLRMSVI